MPTKPTTHAARLRAQRAEQFGRRVGDRQYREQRGDDAVQREADRLRSSTRWKRLRAVKLARNPLCEDCERAGVTTPARDVNHTVPVVDLVARGEPERTFELDLLESLCRCCHNKVTARERCEKVARAAKVRGARIGTIQGESHESGMTAKSRKAGGSPSFAAIDLPPAARASRHNSHGFPQKRGPPPAPGPREPTRAGATGALGAGSPAADPAGDFASPTPLSDREVEAIAATLAAMEGVPIEEARRRVVHAAAAGHRHLDVAVGARTKAELRGLGP